MSEDETLIDFRGVKIVLEEAKLIEEIEEDLNTKLFIEPITSNEAGNLLIENGHVVEINLYKRKFKKKHFLIFKFTKIQKIDLDDTEISEIPFEASNLIFLKELILKYANIKSIEADFHKLQSLKIIYISEGHLDRIPLLPPQIEVFRLINLGLEKFPIELRVCKNLKILNLGRNDITEIPEWFNQTKNTLKRLQLPETQIREIHDWFSEFINMEYFDFENAQVEKVCNFSQMTNISSLRLQGCRLKNFPQGIDNLKNIKYLYLSAQGYPAVSDVFNNKLKLKRLLLNGFDLNTFPNSIAKCKKLEVLNFNNSKMELAKPQLRGLRRLRSLSLVGCNLKTLFDGIFITRDKIDIRNNQIEKMPEKWLQYADRLITDETTWKNPIRPLNLSDDDYLIMQAAKKKIIEPIYSTSRLMGRTLGTFKEGFFIKFSDENILAEEGDLVYPDEIMGLQHLPDGRPFIGLHVGGDWEYPVYVVVFNVKDEIHAFVPLKSNTFNHLNDRAYGNNDSEDNSAIDELIRNIGKTEILKKPLEEKLNILDYSVDVKVILEEIKQKMDEIMGNTMN